MSKTREALEAAIRDAMKKAFNFGQTYWQQADSHFVSQQKKSDITREAFNKLVNDTVRSALTKPEQEPVYQLQNADGAWIDQAKHSYDYNVKHGNSKVRILYTPPQPPQPREQDPCAMRYDFDGYGWKYIDSGSGSDWRTRIKDAEPVYAKPCINCGKNTT